MGWVGPAINAGGQVAGAAVGSYGNKQAAKAQERSNKAALDYTKQKDARAEADALRREGLWQQQYNDWNKMRNAALERYGFSGRFSDLSGYGPQGQQAPMGSAQIPQGAIRRPTRSPYADAIAPQAAEDTPGTRDLRAEVGDWADWRSYGLR